MSNFGDTGKVYRRIEPWYGWYSQDIPFGFDEGGKFFMTFIDALNSP
jgi:hypothetical protein